MSRFELAPFMALSDHFISRPLYIHYSRTDVSIMKNSENNAKGRVSIFTHRLAAHPQGNQGSDDLWNEEICGYMKRRALVLIHRVDARTGLKQKVANLVTRP
jgi:hypothetical protein